MKVRTKTFIIISITFFFLVVVCVSFFRSVIYERFLDIEHVQFRTSLQRIENALDSEFEDLQKVGRDWGSWDATYSFVKDLDRDYIVGNLGFDSLQTLNVNAMIFMNLSGTVRFAKTYDLKRHKEIRFPADLSKALQSKIFIDWFGGDVSCRHGFLRLEDGMLFMFAACPILDSSEKQTPRGIFVTGRFFNAGQVAVLSELLEIPIHLDSLDVFDRVSHTPAGKMLGSDPKDTLIEYVSSGDASGYILLRDIFQRPAGLLRVDLDRSISLQGSTSVMYVIAFFVFISLVFLGIVLLILDRSVLRRLNGIIADVRSITGHRDVSRRISISGKDELGRLGKNLNAMLAALEDEQRKRKAAEAKGVMLTSAIEQLGEDVVLMGPEGNIVYENAAFMKRIFSTGDGKAGSVRGFDDLFDDPRQAEQAKQTVTAGSSWNERCRNQLPDGGSVILDVMITPVTDQDGNVVNTVCIRRDITEKVEIDKRLQLSRKMEALGSLAGGIAHDFNNILTSISGFTQLVGLDVARDSRSHTYLDQILLGVKRAKELVEQILTYSAHKDDPDSAVSVHVPTIVEEALDLAKVSLPSKVVLRRDIARTMNPVLADAGQLHQIVINLCTNAGHAMKESGGELHVIVRSATSEDYTTFHLSPERTGYVCLQVRDTGTGMSRGVRERIFDPFFTTKEPGEGTGLGLPVVHSIVTRMGGIIHVTSEPGKGSQFTLFFPEKKGEHIEVEEPNLENVEGGERILFVDDEEDVVYIAQEMLELLGYDVTATTDSRQAWKIFRDDPQRFDIVVADFSMPHMDGRELTERIFEVTNEVPVLLCSGYMPTLDLNQTVDRELVMILKKPYTSQELTRAMRKLLQTHGKE
ncbi:CHASE4 domain-containing protein [Desulfoplanes sp.]